MSFVLKQRYFFITRTFELTDRSLKIKISKPGTLMEDEFKFEEIGRKITRAKVFPVYFFLFMILGIAGFGICLLSKLSGDPAIDWDIIVSLLIFVCFAAYICAGSYRNNLNLFLIDGRSIVFFAQSPSAQAVDSFFRLIQSTQRNFLLKKYAQMDEFTSPERFILQLKWLYEHNFINATELTALKNKSMVNLATPPGLTFNPNLN